MVRSDTRHSRSFTSSYTSSHARLPHREITRSQHHLQIPPIPPIDPGIEQIHWRTRAHTRINMSCVCRSDLNAHGMARGGEEIGGASVLAVAR
jgi:hypothetical protein